MVLFAGFAFKVAGVLYVSFALGTSFYGLFHLLDFFHLFLFVMIDSFVSVLLLVSHSSWTADCSGWNNPVVILLYVEIQRRRTGIVSTAAALIRLFRIYLWLNVWNWLFLDTFSVIFSRVFIIRIINTVLVLIWFIVKVIKVLPNVFFVLFTWTLCSNYRFLSGPFRINSFMFLFYMHIQSWSWLVNKSAATFLGSILIIR